MTASRRVAWLAAYALALFLAFPQPVAGRVLDLGAITGWVAPACLVLGLRGLAPGRAARWAFAAGLASHALLFHWIYVATVRYGEAHAAIGVMAVLALALYPGLHVGLFGAGAAWLRHRDRAGLLTLAAWWTVTDHLRSFALSGFPWGILGYAQHANPALLAWAPLTGVYGLSFASALGGFALATWVEAGRSRPPSPVVAAVGALALVHLVGAIALRSERPVAAGALRVAVIQGNIDQGVKWSPSWAERTLAIYARLTRRAAARGARLIVWPETAVPGSLDLDGALRERIAELARETGAALVVGAVGVERAGSGWRYYDSAFVFAPDGRLVDRYDKAHLVPFGEYVPLRRLLGHFLHAVAQGMTAADAVPGPRPRAIRVPLRDGRGGVTVGIPICYELLFPDLVRRFVGDGAELLLAITNDAWYGRTGAPYQFLAMTAVRSAENRVWTARAANTGVSAIIDDRGRVRERTPIFEPGMIVADVELRPPPYGGSPFARHGELFAGLCWGWVGASALCALRRRRREERA